MEHTCDAGYQRPGWSHRRRHFSEKHTAPADDFAQKRVYAFFRHLSRRGDIFGQVNLASSASEEADVVSECFLLIIVFLCFTSRFPERD